MIVHLPPGSPDWLRAGATSLLVLHIGSAGAGLLSGAVALASRKGARLHRRAGTVFLAAMLTMAAIGAAVAPLLPQRSSSIAGLFTCYLVATGWMAGHRQHGRAGLPEIAALLFALAVPALGIVFGQHAAHAPSGLLDGDAAVSYYVLAALPALCALADLRTLHRRVLPHAARIRRHIWRMSMALFIASFSFFIGQPTVFPPWLRASPVMALPELAVLVTMIVWLWRTRIRPEPALRA